ncbi:MAG: acetyltransferase [Cyanobacteria bacterium SW_4_48_29]|nr:MAG: acetyltransferase [Cyanobacteria bacterium QS_5_48_63]PSO82776.1 MAG: acetyltransferase [Cyanobacteria bacterium QS_4_48_99]PSO90229.1 MAG: acetyltransferase [Cyanobacteria bacterium QS_6_48_18]PSO95066.1 MAG: acetyltransferase [Cyanobacteria bacterium QS_9_48_30]PSP04780.1 MAG: acetyltransferase [Cyanobacteria bacterium SW_12_48_29]PSP12983.1 MAG: acetyltransferase [Cyanobacteria bacterium SW_10_48_33]PSP20999.1 MAG: acetyltransferase [Cyanobacteria bacterium SW_5_48_44]PSP25604.1 M
MSDVESLQSAEEIEAAITELEKSRERIVNDLFQMAKRVEWSKKVALEHIGQNPEIVRIDATIEELQAKQASLQSPSKA